MGPNAVSQVFVTDSSDREAAVSRLFVHAGLDDLSGKTVALKANFNSADPFPASTHPRTLRTIVTVLKEAGVRDITLAERSGMGDTRQVLEKLGVFALAEELGFRIVVLSEDPAERWMHIQRSGTHWLRGFYLSKVVLESDVVIQTCCLKTHRFGGHFTMSLKNSVGLVAKKAPGGIYDYMYELHGSPFQRVMIAEVNRAYPVDLVIMDAAKAFISGGPDKGIEVEPRLMLACRDRVAVDAVGVAILREFGASTLMKKPIFALDQIRRAAELGVGAASASAIELMPLDEASRDRTKGIRAILDQG